MFCLRLFREINERGENHDAQHQEYGQHQQFSKGGFDGVEEDLEGAVLAHQFKDAEDPNDPQQQDRLEEVHRPAAGQLRVDR